ncbi:probable serine/threonine-protein kinase DDB_G0283337 [Nymphalis io]|uniref:probable serine/threonine-protein kinase DDB_G0283337 n=1 Tax=Inachis io TaxID=171585 RepID=UPI0021681337|nr:probable serine/threonine-protein kinase DDB_G0283337 [Nymphalis io]
MLMVQSNAHPMKTTKIKGPPPVPPRPSQSMVAEALAKTRKAVADSKATLSKSRTFTKNEINHVSSKAKTLDRNSTPNKPSVSPRQNGLARVKSFIKDVISDRSSSSDERKSSGQNSRRSSSDSNSIQSPTSNKSSESLNSKAVKTCKQILVRSLSTSNKLDQDSKCKVSKSSSFAEKTLPLRRAPPPPMSPKPKLKPMKPLPPVQKSVKQSRYLKQPEIGIYTLPVDAKPPQSPITEGCYATVAEIPNVEDRLQNTTLKPLNDLSDNQDNSEHHSQDEALNKNNNSLERKTSRVTEMLISEILASRNNNKDEANAVIDKGKDSTNLSNGNDSSEIEMMKDMNNHEMLIYELQTMRSQSNVPECLDGKDNDDMQCDSDSEHNYAVSLTSGNTEDDQAYAYIQDDDLKSRLRKQFRAISTMSLQGLPPLPKSLSGFADGEPDLRDPPTPAPADDNHPTDLDSQLIYLKKEMASLRQLDLSLLSELWSLSEAMASWRRQLERGPRLRPAPPPPPPPHYLRT